VTIITALGMGQRSAHIMEQMVHQANGTLVKALVLYKARPNDEDNPVGGRQNQDLAVEIVTRAAKEIDLAAL
jgi:hypothetical protein